MGTKLENLVIVESPAKCKTIQQFLGPSYQVLACYGHVQDLVPKSGAVDPDHDFKMRYEPIDKNKKHVDAIAKAAKKVNTIYFSTDPDREGEAISWGLKLLLEERGVLKDKKIARLVFYQLTRSALKEAIESPRDISMSLVQAQKARRSLDHLVGFTLSPLLWRKVRRGLSAGRVQSPALRLLAEREAEIEAFKIEEYWTIEASLQHDQKLFDALLIEYEGHKLETLSITSEDQATTFKTTLEQCAQGQLTVKQVVKKNRKRSPAPPFITSTLQQEASNKIGFRTFKTMRVAQQLYEGVDVGNSKVGLITYMRTDSINLAAEAVTELRSFIAKHYDKKDLPASPRVFKKKTKNAQEAHEAIRPTSILRTPESLRQHLSPDQFKLYQMIWRRTLASQMSEAILNTVRIDLTCGEDHTFRANGSVVIFQGFLKVYEQRTQQDRTTDATYASKEQEKMLPELEEGQTVQLLAFTSKQHFTEPPPRYSEASLVKSLEEYGIGRPSTYASIISTVLNRNYATLENKRFKPSDLGRVVSDFLVQYFPKYVDYQFTAQWEDDLDAVSRDEMQWISLLDNFWKPFQQLVKEIDERVTRQEVMQKPLDQACPKCQAPLSIRLGRRGRFVGCTAFPECDYTADLANEENASSAPAEPEVIEGRFCPQCQSPLVMCSGRYGQFIGCKAYPKCRYIEPMKKPEDTHVACPQCQASTLLKRNTRRGKIFYSCAAYPKCKYAQWYLPLDESCPLCQWPVLALKVTKRHGEQKVCVQKNCMFSEPYSQSQENQDDA